MTESLNAVCEGCAARIEGRDRVDFQNAFLRHVRGEHPDWPFPDIAIRNYADATQRLAPVEPRREELGAVEVHPVTADRIDDWLAFFDRDGFAGNPAWASCYCMEPHMLVRGTLPEQAEFEPWEENRARAVRMLADGHCFGYLAYVDGRPAAWVNASRRCDYARYRLGADRAEVEPGGPPDEAVIGVSCFLVAPPYRRHGLPEKLLERVLADAPGRGADWVEAYPPAQGGDEGPSGFLGRRALYERHGFAPVRSEGPRQIVVRRAVR
ncbi:MAG: GNAT family N-acetyltransferase [Actinomycetota bacterium]|jgi:GNAT superfamily N-acetyltransferase